MTSLPACWPNCFVRLLWLGLLLAWPASAATPPQTLAPASAAAPDPRPELRFAVLAFRPIPEMMVRWQPVANYLDEAIPTHRVVLEALDYPELDQAVRDRRVDLVLTQPAHYVALSVAQNLYSPLATLVEAANGLALTDFGGVILVKASHPDIRTLADLRGRRIATSHRESLGGFQAQAYELHELGIPIGTEQITETGTQDGVLAALREGKAEIGFVRTGLLEQMAKEGKLDPAEFRVIKPAQLPTYPLQLSTRLYPQWALAAMPWLEQAVARQVAGAMLSLPHHGAVARTAHISGFNIPGDYRSVDRLMRALRVPPFDKRVPLQVIWEDHRSSVVMFGLLLLATAMWTLQISLRARRQRMLADELQRQAAVVFEHASEGIVITDTRGIILNANSAFSEITGYRREEVIGHNPSLLASGRQGREFYVQMWQRLAETGQWSGEIWNRRKSGEVYAEMLTINAVNDPDGRPQLYVGLFHDITTLKEQQLQLEHIAHYDALTQLPNRVLLADRLQQALNQAERRRKEIAVVYIDLDGFKQVNDLYGHASGDQLLIELASRMKQALREGDTLARLGGDEFVIVLLDLDNHAASAPILERLLQVAAWPVELDGQSLRVSASLGVTFFPQNDDIGADQLMRQADQAMYIAKQSGKNRYHIFDAEQDRAVRGRHESIERIREALENHEFMLYYQPKVNMRSGRLVGTEALLRWQHPEQGIVPPAWFLPLVEDHELIKPIGDWVIETALRQMEAWQAQGLILPVSVNVAGRQLQSPDFLGKLRVALHQHPTVAHQLELEVLESSALEDIAQISELMTECQAMGISFDLDDFGTGYSSLTYLKRLPAKTLKIDQSFVRDMLEDADDLAILDGIIGLAESFQRNIIAEGVETAEHSKQLLRLGCELGQGYAIARPMPAADIPDWAATWCPPEQASPRQIERDELPVLFAMTEHRAWVKALELYLQDRQPAPPNLDHHQCRFGQWLDRSGTVMYGHHPLLAQVISLHEEIHRRAGELLDMKHQGRGKEAWAGFDRLQIAALRDQLLSLLESLLVRGIA